MSIYVFRNESVQKALAQGASFDEEVRELVAKTVYKRRAALEDAPSFTDCLTLVHYVFKKSVNVEIFIDYIGNMPRQLLSQRDWQYFSIKPSEAQPGDVIFTRCKNQRRLVTHVCIVIERDKILHCTSSEGTAQIQSVKDFFSNHEQIEFQRAIQYIDSRDKELRAHQGIYICE